MLDDIYNEIDCEITHGCLNGNELFHILSEADLTKGNSDEYKEVQSLLLKTCISQTLSIREIYSLLRSQMLYEYLYAVDVHHGYFIVVLYKYTVTKANLNLKVTPVSLNIRKYDPRVLFTSLSKILLDALEVFYD